jgi:hypothetical protein
MNLSNRKESAAETFKSTSLIGLSYKGKERSKITQSIEAKVEK